MIAKQHSIKQRGGRKWRTCLQVSGVFPDKDNAAYQYSEVLHKSFLFYFQQRSGKLPHQVSAVHLRMYGGRRHLAG